MALVDTGHKNVSKLNIVDQFYVDIHHDKLQVPINFNFHITPERTFRNYCFLGGAIFCHERTVFDIH